MTNNLEISLSIKDIKNTKIISKSTAYYLIICLEQDQKIVTPSTNILYQQLFYTLKEENRIESIELWNYDTSKKVGTIYIKNYRFIEKFQHYFKKQNLQLTLRTRQYGQPISEDRTSITTGQSEQDCLKTSKSTVQELDVNLEQNQVAY